MQTTANQLDGHNLLFFHANAAKPSPHIPVGSTTVAVVSLHAVYYMHERDTSTVSFSLPPPYLRLQLFHA